MSIWVSWGISCFLFNIFYCKIFNMICNCKKRLLYKDIIVCLIIAFIDGYTIYLNIGIRALIMFISFASVFKLVFNRELGNTLVLTFLIQILFAFSEMFFGITAFSILRLPSEFLTQNTLGILFTNVSIIIIALCILRIKFIKKKMQSIIHWYKEQNFINLIITIAVGCATILFLLYKNLNGINNIFEFIINNIFLLGISYFVICFLIEKSSYNKISHKYDNLLDYAKTYEQEVVEKSKWQHEYENQLLIIKDKIPKKAQEAHEYIDHLLKNRPVSKNSQWLGKLSKFPDLGIKGLLCYKIDQMQEKGINVFVDVADDIRITKKHSQLLEKNLQDISRILGVYIDNAIDAALKSTNKYLIFEVNCIDNKIVFQISNTFSGDIDLQKIGTLKYSTKGYGHGYGLSLVNDILNQNTLLSEEREINGMYFVQKLIIDIKNNIL